VSLYCIVCKSPVDEGLNQCYNCKTGFTSQLACSVCRRPVSRGLASCPYCGIVQQAPNPSADIVLMPPVGQSLHNLIGLVPLPELSKLPVSLPVLPGLPMRATQPPPERYMVRKHGVEAEVAVPPGDIEIMQAMSNLAIVLHAVAEKMNHFVGHMEITRENIKGCRSLATNLQEEIELRKGPLG
jgi:RNA polymerase subunit RPABC4/transcription elongation factor Spt4